MLHTQGRIQGEVGASRPASPPPPPPYFFIFLKIFFWKMFLNIFNFKYFKCSYNAPFVIDISKIFP